jgi:NADPH-dependent curcumin reductase CurA
MDPRQTPDTPATFHGIGYTRPRDSLPLEAIEVPVPRPAADQVLIHVKGSSLNPLEYKLAELNFLGRKPPVILGFDLSGLIVTKGEGVQGFIIGDEVTAMADSNLERAMAWATEGLVVPHIGKTTNSTVADINDGLQAMKSGNAPPGKIAVTVERNAS